MIKIDGLHMNYQTDEGTVHAVRGISLEVAEGEFYTLLGPSGCGKTTTLRALAGLETPTGGEISISGEIVFSAGRGVTVPPHRRDTGMVFQSYAIWPHMTVFENVAFPLREMRPRLGRAVIREKVRRALELVQLSGYEERPAPFLSGGQQQRLALARALVKEPSVLLLDEPLSNLDAKLREETRVELRELVKRLGITTVYVTHDQIEALTMSDRVAVMDHGEIIQEDAPLEIYDAPRSRFVAGFIGQTNFLEGEVANRGATNGGGNGASGPGTVKTRHGDILCALPEALRKGDKVTIAIRPEDVTLTTGAPRDGDNVVDGTVSEIQFLGESLDAAVALGEESLRLRLHPTTRIELGQLVSLSFAVERCRALTE